MDILLVPHMDTFNSLRFACAKGNFEHVKTLVEGGADIRAYGNTHVRIAASEGHLKIVQYLFSKGADIRLFEDTALIQASQNGHYKVVEFLAEHGANVRAQNDYAIRNIDKLLYFDRHRLGRHFEVARVLVKFGVPIGLVQNQRCRRYILFCNRIGQTIEERNRIRAQKKIYFWWIQIFFDPESNVGKRMLEKRWLEFDKLQKKN